MANLVQAESNAILAASSGQAAYVAPTAPIMVSLVTALGSATAPGTEVAGGSYIRQPITFAAPAGGTISSNVALTYPGMPAATIVRVEEWDSAGTPVRRWFGSLSTPKVVNAGDTFSVSVASYSKSLS